MKVDGHIHTPYCPHGSSDTFEEYITRAIELNYDEISFTEHAPLPPNFIDPTPDKDSGMDYSRLENYLSDLKQLQIKYQQDLKINIGLEVDFIEGYERETELFLNEYGPYLDDSILSVHFLKKEDNYYCVDFSADMFKTMIPIFSSIEVIYETYYDLLKKSIQAELGRYKPKRIGHITLVHKFQKLFPCSRDFSQEINSILREMANYKLQLDYNSAGVVKPYCEEPYPPEWIVKEAIKQKIPLVYGSDAHSAKDLEQGYGFVYAKYFLTSPTKL